MGEAAASFKAVATEAGKTLLVEAIVEAVYEAGLKIPKPVIRMAVTKVLDAVPEIDRETVTRILGFLGISELVDRVTELLGWETSADAAEVDCPESGTTIRLADGDGTYTCPDCGQDIEVEDGEAAHTFLVGCPVEEETFWAGLEGGTYECPHCDMDVIVDDGNAEHEDVPGVVCPRSGDTIQLTQGDGTYECPDCGASITVDDGDVKHDVLEPLSRRRRPRLHPRERAPSRRRVAK